MPPINLLINLPPGFYKTPVSKAVLARADKLGAVRRRSWNRPEEIAKDLEWADAVVMWSWPSFSEEMLDRAPKLRFVGNIDIGREMAERYARRGIPVSLAKRCWSPAVAEMALALSLGLLRKTSAYHAAMRVGKEAWLKDFPRDADPDERELTGRSVGIVGLGGVGRRFAELLAPFRCRLRVFDPFLPDGVAEQVGGTKVELAELIAESDVVVLCAAANSGTSKLIGRRQIARMRKGAVLVNVARSVLVDTDALVERLKKGDLYAAIDVFDQEPPPANHPLRKLPNAYLTPHRAGGLLVSVERALTMLLDDLEAHLAGRPRQWALTEAMLPGLDGPQANPKNPKKKKMKKEA